MLFLLRVPMFVCISKVVVVWHKIFRYIFNNDGTQCKGYPCSKLMASSDWLYRLSVVVVELQLLQNQLFLKCHIYYILPHHLPWISIWPETHLSRFNTIYCSKFALSQISIWFLRICDDFLSWFDGIEIFISLSWHAGLRSFRMSCKVQR